MPQATAVDDQFGIRTVPAAVAVGAGTTNVLLRHRYGGSRLSVAVLSLKVGALLH